MKVHAGDGTNAGDKDRSCHYRVRGMKDGSFHDGFGLSDLVQPGRHHDGAFWCWKWIIHSQRCVLFVAVFTSRNKNYVMLSIMLI